MPHLQFEVTEPLDGDEIDEFAEWVMALYADVMDTGTDHVAVTVRDDTAVTMGRADADEPVAVLNADVRVGRSFEQRSELATAVVDELADRWGVPEANVYVVYTEHPGEDFLLAEGPLQTWSADESGGEGPPGIE